MRSSAQQYAEGCGAVKTGGGGVGGQFSTVVINRGHGGLNYLLSVTLRKSQRDSDEFGRRLHALLSLRLCHKRSKRMRSARIMRDT